MTLLQLKQIVDKALEEQPELAGRDIRFLGVHDEDDEDEENVTVSYPIGGMSLGTTGRLQLIHPELIPEDKLWLP